MGSGPGRGVAAGVWSGEPWRGGEEGVAGPGVREGRGGRATGGGGGDAPVG